jgi:hypothetical protein
MKTIILGLLVILILIILSIGSIGALFGIFDILAGRFHFDMEQWYYYLCSIFAQLFN